MSVPSSNGQTTEPVLANCNMFCVNVCARETILNNIENQHTKKVLNLLNEFNVCVKIFVKIGIIWFLYGLKSVRKSLKRGFPKFLYTLGSNFKDESQENFFFR